MSTSFALGSLLATNADINYYETQLVFWNNKYTSNQKLLNKQVKNEEAYNKAYDSAMSEDKSSALNMHGKEYIGKNEVNEAKAVIYAHYKSPDYDEAYSEELADLDIEYDTMKTMCETLLEELRAEADAEKNLASTDAQNTHLLGQ